MSEPTVETASESQATFRAIRLGFTALVVAISYLNFRVALGILAFQTIYKDMLGARPLPETTILVLHMQPMLVGASLVIPAVAILGSFLRPSFSINICSILILLICIQLILTCSALYVPLFGIIRQMGEHP